MASVCGNGLNGICQRQGHTGVEREKEERRADRRTDRQTGRRTPGAVGGTWNNRISLRADLLAGRGTGCSSPALSTAPASVDAASSPPQTTRVSSSCARHPRVGSRGPSPAPPYNLGAPASTRVSRERGRAFRNVPQGPRWATAGCSRPHFPPARGAGRPLKYALCDSDCPALPPAFDAGSEDPIPHR